MPTLYTSTTTPYGRLILMIAYLQNIDLPLKFVLPFENPDELLKVNPFSQVPALLLENGDTITETPLIIQAIAPQVYTDNPSYDLPRISKALTILFQGVRAYSTERFSQSAEPHPFVARSEGFLKSALPNLPTLSADSEEWGDRILLCALAWIGFRLPSVFECLSSENKQAVTSFANSEMMQKISIEALENKPASTKAL